MSEPRPTIDQSNWHPSWIRFASDEASAVVLHEYNSGIYYVIVGPPDFPGRETLYVGPDREEADAIFDETVESWRASHENA